MPFYRFIGLSAQATPWALPVYRFIGLSAQATPLGRARLSVYLFIGAGHPLAVCWFIGFSDFSEARDFAHIVFPKILVRYFFHSQIFSLDFSEVSDFAHLFSLDFGEVFFFTHIFSLRIFLR